MVRHLIQTHAGLLFAGIATFVVMGAGQALFGPALPVYGRLFGLEQGQTGTLISVLWVGCFLGVGAMFLWGAQISPRQVLAVMVLGSAVLAAAPGWGAVMLGAAVFGAGYGMATAVFNPRVLRAFGRHGPSMLSLLNATFGVGAILAPLVFVWLGSSTAWGFGLLALITAVIWLGAGPTGRVEAASQGPIQAFRPHWGILAFGLVAIGLEASLAGLGPTALIRAGVSETRAAELLSAFFVVFLLARVGLIFLAHRIAPFALYLAAIGSAGLFALGALFLSPPVFFVAMGASAGLFFPSYYVTASGKMGEDIRVPPTIIAAGLVGAIGMPALLAPLVAGLGERGFFQILAAILLVVTAAAILSRAKMRV